GTPDPNGRGGSGGGTGTGRRDTLDDINGVLGTVMGDSAPTGPSTGRSGVPGGHGSHDAGLFGRLLYTAAAIASIIELWGLVRTGLRIGIRQLLTRGLQRVRNF